MPLPIASVTALASKIAFLYAGEFNADSYSCFAFSISGEPAGNVDKSSAYFACFPAIFFSSDATALVFSAKVAFKDFKDLNALRAFSGIIPNRFGLGIFGLAKTLSTRLVILALVPKVLSATVGNLSDDPPPDVSDAKALTNAAAAPGLNAPDNLLDSPPSFEPASPNKSLIPALGSLPENAAAAIPPT